MKSFKEAEYDKFEILELSGYPYAAEILSGDYNSNDGGIARSHDCSESEAVSIIKLWDSLSEDAPFLCHDPGYAIRISSKGSTLFVASICWDCNNIYLAGSHADGQSINFAAGSNEGQKLLKACMELCQQ